MGEVLYESGIDRSALEGQRIAVLGYGSQGHAHALNLRDSGFDVRVGLRSDSKSWPRAEEDGLRVVSPSEAAAEADAVMVLLPDTAQPASYAADVAPNLAPGDLLLFAHGFNIHFNQIRPAEGVDVGMVAPKAPGHLVRRTFADGIGTPALFAVHRDATGTARARVLAYAGGIGAGRAGIIETTFAEETETDLFGEQAVLCGGVTSLIQAGFETLVKLRPERVDDHVVGRFRCRQHLLLVDKKPGTRRRAEIAGRIAPGGTALGRPPLGLQASKPPLSTAASSKPSDLSIHQKRVAHIMVPML